MARASLVALMFLVLLAGAAYAARSSPAGDVSAASERGCLAAAEARITPTMTEWAWKSGTLHAAIVGATRADTPVPAQGVRLPDRRAPESPPLITPLRI